MAAILTDISADDNLDRSYAGYTNMMLVMKCLHRKRHIDDATLQARVNQCLEERSKQQQQLKRPGANFDPNRSILYTAMKLNVFTEFELITDEIAILELCIECDGILMAKNLDLMYNHTFLGNQN